MNTALRARLRLDLPQSSLRRSYADPRLSLRLAVLDPSPNVIYLARPCQFVGSDPACGVAYWTSWRYAEEVVSSMGEALDQAIAGLPGHGVHLVGYSGGGTIAALLAERRADVMSLRTIAGNLDVSTVNRHNRVSATPNSLNPIDNAASLTALPQIHWIGEDDNVVPPVVAQRFVGFPPLRSGHSGPGGNPRGQMGTSMGDARRNCSAVCHPRFCGTA